MPLCACPIAAPGPSCPPVNNNQPAESKVEVVRKPVSAPASQPFQSFQSFSMNSWQYDDRMTIDDNLRDAIKAKSIDGVRSCLAKGANAQHIDRGGLSMLHLAAVMSHEEICTILIQHGARADVKNSQNETALDCAPPALQNKLKALLG